jgi:hypothetical protein
MVRAKRDKWRKNNGVATVGCYQLLPRSRKECPFRFILSAKHIISYLTKYTMKSITKYNTKYV